MHAAKHFDPQLGIDIHMYAMPPVPLPTPHIGLVFDPFDYLPFIGGTIHVNGVKRATAGTGGLDIHIPLGPWMPTLKMPGGPQFEDELFMGSMTVIADGDPFSRIGMPVLDCNLVGMINPFRVRKPKVPQLSMSLPTAVNLAIPNTVNIGGPPMISLMGMAFKGLFAGLGRLRKSARFQKAMDNFREFRRAKFDHLPSGFLKCKILRAEPVDIRHGSVEVEHEDFSIPGRLPLTWTRRYSSTSSRMGSCGFGWETPADICLEVHPGGMVEFRLPDGHFALFTELPDQCHPVGIQEMANGSLLSRVVVKGKTSVLGETSPDVVELHVRTKDDLIYVFNAPPENVSPIRVALTLAIERMEDRHGNYWRFERVADRLVRIAESGVGNTPGRFLVVSELAGFVHHIALHDPATGVTHPLVHYSCDAAGDLIAAYDALDAPRTFKYSAHHMIAHTDRTGLSFYYAFDTQGRVTHAWGDHGLYDYRFAYNELIKETEITDSLGHTSLVKFDGNNLPLCEIDPLGGCTFFEYDDFGRTTAVTDPMGLRTEFAYDDRGNLLQLTRPDDTVITTDYNADNKAIAITDPAGGHWQQRWTDKGLLHTQATPLGAKRLFDYNTQGQLTNFTDPRGAVTQLEFDRHGQLLHLVSPMGQRTQFEHDALGRLLKRTDAAGRSTKYQYDVKGRLLKATLPSDASVSCEYDAEDQLTRYVDENGATTELSYFGIGQIAERKQPDGHRVRYQYDTEEQLTAVINQRGETYQLKRDPLGRIVEEVDYWGQGRRYDYDAAGRITTSTDPLGRIVAFATDKLGRVIQKILPDANVAGLQAVESFKYNKAGQLIELRNSASHVKRQFDADGRMVEEEQNGFKVKNDYDQTGNRTQRKTSAGNTVQVSYDLADQPQQITINDEAPIVITRNAMGQAVKEQLSPHLSRALEYNNDGLLTRQAALKDHAPIFDTRFDYDKSGNLTTRQDSDHSRDSYTYDPMGRILAHTDPTGQVKKYLNDPAGDRLKTRVQEVQMKQAVGGQQQPTMWTREGELGELHYIFDRAGNLTSRRNTSEHNQPELQLEWDANQRLAKSQWQRGDKHGQVTTYAYDPLGRRVLKKNPTHTTHFFWDGDALLAEVKQANEPAPAPHEVKVVDFIAAKRKKDTLKLLHPEAREYVYRPGTFEPLALIDKGAKKPVVVGAAATSTPQPTPLQAPQKVPVVPPQTVCKLTSGDLSGFGVLGAGGLGLGLAGAAPPQAPANYGNPSDITPLAGLGMAATGMGSGHRLVPQAAIRAVAPSIEAVIQPTASRAATPMLATAPELLGKVFYYFNDPNGCPTRLTSSTGTVVWAATYTAWGKVAELTVNLVKHSVRLQGQQEDEETGFYYNRYRYFDPGQGAYIGGDPLGLAANENFYCYGPNIFGWIDPFGLTCTPSDFGLSTIADNPALLRMWRNALKNAASAVRDNGYKRYLDAIDNGQVLSQRMLEDAFGAVNSRFMREARAAGETIAQVHHWNYPKGSFSDQIVDPRHLVPVDSRAVHENLHRATSSTTDIWSGPIANEHILPIPSWSTPLLP